MLQTFILISKQKCLKATVIDLIVQNRESAIFKCAIFLVIIFFCALKGLNFQCTVFSTQSLLISPFIPPKYVGLQNLVQRNEQLYSSGDTPSGGVALPFILVQVYLVANFLFSNVILVILNSITISLVAPLSYRCVTFYFKKGQLFYQKKKYVNYFLVVHTYLYHLSDFSIMQPFIIYINLCVALIRHESKMLNLEIHLTPSHAIILNNKGGGGKARNFQL